MTDNTEHKRTRLMRAHIWVTAVLIGALSGAVYLVSEQQVERFSQYGASAYLPRLFSWLLQASAGAMALLPALMLALWCLRQAKAQLSLMVLASYAFFFVGFAWFAVLVIWGHLVERHHNMV